MTAQSFQNDATMAVLVVDLLQLLRPHLSVSELDLWTILRLNRQRDATSTSLGQPWLFFSLVLAWYA